MQKFDELDDGDGEQTAVRLAPVFSGEQFKKTVDYPVIVEMWEKKNSGRVRRAYLAQFTDDERTTLARYYAKFYKWHLVTGTPVRVMARLKTVQLLQRAVNFFATI